MSRFALVLMLMCAVSANTYSGQKPAKEVIHVYVFAAGNADGFTDQADKDTVADLFLNERKGWWAWGESNSRQTV
jgi:hypothetical protein